MLGPDWCILWMKQGWPSPRCIILWKHGGRRERGLRYWTEGSQVLNQSLTEVSAQSGWTVVHSELDEGVQEVPVQVGELLTWTHLLQVVRGNDQEVTEGVECVEKLQHQRDLVDRGTKTFTPCKVTHLTKALHDKSQISKENILFLNALLYLTSISPQCLKK